MAGKKSNQFKLHLFYCSNCADEADFNILHEETGDEYKMTSLPCSGKVDLLYLLKAFETGADCLILVTCAKNECHYLEGNLRAPKRIEAVNAILEEAGMGKGRLAVIPKDEKGVDDVIRKIVAFRSAFSTRPSNANVT
jgi:F420-non-reducing hydrogenase iron-sulfur subunit